MSQTMNPTDYTETLSFDQAPTEVFNAINNVRGWWNDTAKGTFQKLDDEFETRFGDVHYSKQKLIEVVPDKKVVWLVTDSHLNFLGDKTEWTGTRVCFEISRKENKTYLQFTHVGLRPKIECYDACSTAWGQYLRYSLFYLVTTGKGQPGFPPDGPSGK